MVKRDNLEEEFLHLLNENFGILLKIAGSYSKTTHDREDLLSETVLQLWQAYPSFGGRSKGSTWLYRVALNTALNKSGAVMDMSRSNVGTRIGRIKEQLKKYQ